MFKAIQTCSGRSRVAWVEEPAPGRSVEPDHPAPTIALAAPKTGSQQPGPAAGSGVLSPTAAPSATAAPASSGGARSGSVVGAYPPGVRGLLARVAGLALGLGARRRPVTVDGSESVRTGVE